MTRSSIPTLVLALAAAACGSGGDEPDAQPSRTAAAADTTAGATPPPAPPNPVETPDANGYSSAYTPFDIDTCTVLTENREEGSSATYRCPGYEGIPIFIQEGDLRFDLDAGAENRRFDTTGPFDTIADTLEWRMKNGRPFAVIFRYNVHDELGPPPTELAVEKIGTASAPGCRVAQIAGSTPDANRRARELADERAAAFACGTDKPVNIGGTLTPASG